MTSKIKTNQKNPDDNNNKMYSNFISKVWFGMNITITICIWHYIIYIYFQRFDGLFSKKKKKKKKKSFIHITSCYSCVSLYTYNNLLNALIQQASTARTRSLRSDRENSDGCQFRSRNKTALVYTIMVNSGFFIYIYMSNT